jgi:hypothetical protein
MTSVDEVSNEMARLARFEAALKRREQTLEMEKAEIQRTMAALETDVQKKVTDSLRAGLFQEIEDRELRVTEREGVLAEREKAIADEGVRIARIKSDLVAQLQPRK